MKKAVHSFGHTLSLKKYCNWNGYYTTSETVYTEVSATAVHVNYFAILF